MRTFFGLFILLHLSSCGVYKQNIMFRTRMSIIKNASAIEARLAAAETNYVIQSNDYIEIRVYSDSGEVIIDPPELGVNPNQGQNINQLGLNPGQNNQLGAQGTGGNTLPLVYPYFIVYPDGYANLPLVGKVQLMGYTLAEADSVIADAYSTIYNAVYVRTRYLNKRVIVFRGAGASIYPLTNEKVSLIEVLAATGGVSNDLRATNIRLIRGDLRDPDIYVIDLTTMEGLRQYDLTVQANDIIYIEPIRRPFFESLRDVSPLLGIVGALTSTVASIVTLVLLINNQ